MVSDFWAAQSDAQLEAELTGGKFEELEMCSKTKNTQVGTMCHQHTGMSEWATS